MVENGLAGAFFDNFPLIHDQDAIAEQPHDVEIVRNKQVAHAEALPQAGQEMQDHRLHRHIEGRCGFVQNEQRRVQGNSARNPNAGFLAARELMWEALERSTGKPTSSANSCTRPELAAVMEVAQTPQWLSDRRKGRETRIEAVGRVLKDQLQARPFWRARKTACRHGSNVASGKMDGTRRGVQQAGDHPYQRGFATARFTDQANAFA